MLLLLKSSWLFAAGVVASASAVTAAAACCCWVCCSSLCCCCCSQYCVATVRLACALSHLQQQTAVYTHTYIYIYIYVPFLLGSGRKVSSSYRYNDTSSVVTSFHLPHEIQGRREYELPPPPYNSTWCGITLL